ncbi:hypothetical protein L226DRAFT_554217 [Lentinus tigrinus ALCF2SS1-7]|uniref:BTB domain-containing protein n=1 Tax=Lentinus tigrinus ALCF2SS1-6 TaxID=1328759 RepID=A0A5C2S1P0_9APHY|nr:hypothetical protein L227DRAFT_594763 [Lentinus tigrinus ALCF2SS1-6]RPD72098.1 hypothetical protein L226DRAFT_554217 [Lentinus tigrinus ALCF2SS1-7]
MTFSPARTTTMRYPSSDTQGEVPPFPVPHPDYYFEDGNLIILVENTLFRVFRSTFTRHSAVFRDLFNLPRPVGGSAEGLDDDNPLHFSGISAVDFERLLWILYPTSSNYGEWKARNLDEWTSILSLATRWEFNDIRTLAIRQLQTLDGISPVDKVVLGREYEFSGRWVLSAYIALCERSEPLSIPEASRLGLETAMRIAQLREQLRAGGRKSSRIGGYHTLTQSAAVRHSSTVASTTKPPRADRQQWGIGRSFLDRGDIPPPARMPHQKPLAKKGTTAIPGTARLVAEAFGIELVR